MDAALGYAVLLCLCHDVVQNSDTVFSGLGDTGVVAEQSHDVPLGVGYDREYQVYLVAFAGYGVDHSGALAELHAVEAYLRIRAVYCDLLVGYALDEVDHPFHRLYFVLVNAGAAIDEVLIRKDFVLLSCNVEYPLLVVLGNGLGHGRDGSVDLFSNNNHLTSPVVFSLKWLLF